MAARKIHPLVGVALKTVIKAGARAFDSVLEDAEDVATEAVRRVKRGRKRLHKVARARVARPPPSPPPPDDEGVIEGEVIDPEEE